MVFAVTGRTNGRLPPDGVVMSPDQLATLRDQTPCDELVEQRMRWATWSVATFLALAFGGAVLGLVDDRLLLRRAPRFESLLRERPSGLPGDVWDRPVVPVSDIGVQLPVVESSDVEAFVVWSLATVVGLAIIGGLADMFDALGSMNLVGLVVALMLALGARVVAGSQLASVDSGNRSQADRLRRAVPVMLAADWAGRVRPAFGAMGVEEHALVRAGVARDRVVRDLGVLCGVAVLAHLGVTGLLFLGAVVFGGHDGGWPPHALVSVLVASAMVVAGLVVGAARFRQLPCTIDRSTFDAARRALGERPTDLLVLVGLSIAMPLVHGVLVVVLVASLASPVAVVPILFWVSAALAVRVLVPVPEGFVGTDVVLLIGLCFTGVAPAAAAVAVLLWRVLMVWLPLGPGYAMTRSLVRRGVL